MSTENANVEDVKVEEIKPDHAIALITKAEIDTHIATAKAFPRSISEFLKKAMSMATVSEEIAESCIYALPRAGKFIEGPSVRLAEIVAACYKNLQTGARVIYNDGKTITAQGIVYDLEGNIRHTEEVQRRITDKNGKTYSEDMQVVAGRAACAVAYRNAVFKVVPAALIEEIYEKVKQVAKGNAETLVARRNKAMAHFRGLGVKDEAIFAVLEVRDENEIDLEKLAKLSMMKSALKNGEATLESLFPPPDPAAKGKKATDKANETLGRKQNLKDLTKQVGEDLENKGAE